MIVNPWLAGEIANGEWAGKLNRTSLLDVFLTLHSMSVATLFKVKARVFARVFLIKTLDFFRNKH